MHKTSEPTHRRRSSRRSFLCWRIRYPLPVQRTALIRAMEISRGWCSLGPPFRWERSGIAKFPGNIVCYSDPLRGKTRAQIAGQHRKQRHGFSTSENTYSTRQQKKNRYYKKYIALARCDLTYLMNLWQSTDINSYW